MDNLGVMLAVVVGTVVWLSRVKTANFDRVEQYDRARSMARKRGTIGWAFESLNEFLNGASIKMKIYRMGIGGSFGVAVLLTVLTGGLAAGEWKVGDHVVTTREAAVQAGTKTLTTVPADTALDVTAVNGDWVAVSVQRDGEEITGWIHVKHLALAGQPAARMSEQAKAATARLKTISKFREAGDLAEIGRLIEAGADVNLRNSFGVTPLWMASQGGHTEVVKLLLASKADVNVAYTDGRTPLWQASLNGHTEVVKLLLANKADVNAVHTDGRTPLWMASQEGHTEVVKLLLANKADVNAKKTTGTTALWIASQEGHTEVVKLLLTSKADVNANPALFIASQNGHVEIVKLLLANKAEVNTKVSIMGNDYTPLSMAQQGMHREVVELLKKHGAKE
jgi:ankyrin repeat protein